MKNSDFPPIQKIMDDLTGRDSPNGPSAHPPSESQDGRGAFAGATCSVESSSRQVIERKLLTALSEENTVAILASNRDLDTLIVGLENYEGPTAWRLRCLEMAKSLRELQRAAFPPNERVRQPGN